MTDEELRKFCLEQAVKVIVANPNMRDFKGFCNTESISVFDLANAFVDYVKSGKNADVHVSLRYLVE